MPKVRVYQLAKELQVQSALILELLDRLGQEVKSDLSVLADDVADLVRRRIILALDVEKKRLAEEHRLHPSPAGDGGSEVEGLAVTTSEPLVPPAEPLEGGVPAAAPRIAPKGPPPIALPSRGSEVPTGAGASHSATATTRRVFAARRLVPHPSVKVAQARAAAAASRNAPLAPGRPPVAPGGRPPAAALPTTPAAPKPPLVGTTLPKSTKPRRRHDEPEERLAGVSASRPKADLPPVPTEISLSEAVTVKELAEKLNRKSKDVIAKLIAKGVLANINQPLDPAMAIDIAKEFGSQAKIISFEEEAQQTHEAELVPIEGLDPARPEDLRPRPPVVTVMGHVDHGKTSLLDAIRETKVVEGEAGGITQHIGAYQVEARGRKITFLDTPGHEAFTLMRARGAKVTDIVVLVVAADDGVKPQTLEAIDHARAAEVPIVVAINKIDKPGASPDRVKRQLNDIGLVVEEYGGEVVCCEISAKKRQGIDEMLDMIHLVADLKELKASPKRAATGVVLETKLDRARGIVATVLVQDGTLRTGDPFIAGAAYGKVRALVDDRGRRVQEIGPSTPGEVTGFAGEPTAGDNFQTLADEGRARQIASFRQEKLRAETQLRSARRTLESLAQSVAQGEIKELPVILKADSQGSIEALQKSMGDLPQDKIRVRLIRASIGAISQADVLLASASNAVVVGFNVRPDRATADLAKHEEIEIRLYTVIYDLLTEIRQAMLGMLEPLLKESVLGQAEVRQLFRVPKVGVVAGCYVTDGKVARNSEVRLLRDNVVVYTGKVSSLRRFKEDVSEVKAGFECGIGIMNYNDLKERDVIEFFVTEKIAAQSL